MALKALFVIAVTTSRMIFPGIPALAPGTGGVVVAPEGPPAVRSLTMQLLSSDSSASPSATVTIPEALKLGETADLQVTKVATPAAEIEGATKITLKKYWGSSDEVRAGQPSVKNVDSVEPQPVARQSYKTVGIWPARGPGSQTGLIAESASVEGTYKLATNYTGGTSLTLGSEQNFLSPVDLSGLEASVDLEKPIKVEWKTVPNALAYSVVAYGGSEEETVLWTAGSEVGSTQDIDRTPLSRERVAELIEQKVLLPSDATTATIPAGIFKDSMGVMLTVTAIGTDKMQEKDGIETQVIVRSIASVPLQMSRFAM